MDEWLRQWMIRAGLIRADGVSRKVSYGRCPTCKATVLRALNGDICAWAVTMDVGEVDKVGEFLALLQGRQTYELLPKANGTGFARVVEPRSSSHISKPRRNPVVIEHRCGVHIAKAPSTTFRGFPDECPF